MVHAVGGGLHWYVCARRLPDSRVVSLFVNLQQRLERDRSGLSDSCRAVAATCLSSGRTPRRTFPFVAVSFTRIPCPRTSSTIAARSRIEYALETVIGLIANSSAICRTEGRNSPAFNRPPATCARI